MSGFEIVGVVLGALPLVIEGLEIVVLSHNISGKTADSMAVSSRFTHVVDYEKPRRDDRESPYHFRINACAVYLHLRNLACAVDATTRSIY